MSAAASVKRPVDSRTISTPSFFHGRFAGSFSSKTWISWPSTVIELALATNAAAPLVMADLFCRSFSDDAIPRRIINISSGAAQTAIAGSAVYSMSKAALEMLTRSIAAEYTAPRFRCISLRPGIFETAMQAYMRSRDPAEFPSVGLFRGFKENGLLKDPADVAERIVDRLVQGPVENGRTYSHTDF